MRQIVAITANDLQLWEKLERIRMIDPTIGGGIKQIVFGNRVLKRHGNGPVLFRSGYQEVHEIEAGFCAHIADAFLEQDWRVTATSERNTIRFRIAFSGTVGYSDRNNLMVGGTALSSFIIRPHGDALTAYFRRDTAYRYCSLSVTQDYLHSCLGLKVDEIPSSLLTCWARRETMAGHFPMSKATMSKAAQLFGIKSQGAWRHLAIRAIAFDLLRLLFEDWESARPSTKLSIRITLSERRRLDNIRDQIDQNPARPLTLKLLCLNAKMSRNKVHLGFKQRFGVSIHDYQTDVRMRIAMDLLESSNLPIGEIAERAGFSEPTNFTAAFKKYFATLPRDVRLNLREE